MNKFTAPAEGVSIYFKLLNKYKRTSRLFNLIPFNFKLVKYQAVVLFAVIFLTTAFITNYYIINLVLFLLLSTEYVRVFDYRMEILGESILNEGMFQITLKNDGLVSDVDQGDPLYVTVADQEYFFLEARCSVWSEHIFEKFSNKIRNNKTSLSLSIKKAIFFISKN
jgi:hypothetical protein